MYEEDDDLVDSTVACPHCGEGIYDDVDQCPYCDMNVSRADFKKSMPVWVMIIIALTILGFLLAAF